jgi:hypothetical protein
MELRCDLCEFLDFLVAPITGMPQQQAQPPRTAPQMFNDT